MSLFSVFHFQYLNLFTWKNNLTMFVFLFIYSLTSIFLYEPSTSIYYSLFSVFYSPRIPLLDLFRALLFVMSFIILFNQFFHQKLKEQSSNLLLRIRSTKLYFHTSLCMMFLFIIFYVFFTYILILLINLLTMTRGDIQVKDSAHSITNIVIGQQYILIVLTISLLLLINHLLVLLIYKKEIATMVFLVLFIGSFNYMSHLARDSSLLSQWFGFFYRYSTVTTVDYFYKCLILLFGIVVLYRFSYIVFQRKKDFFT